MSEIILGISAYYHDSAAVILVNGAIVAAAQEERYTRKKHDPSFPIHAIKSVLVEAGVDYSDLTAIAYYEKPFLKFERLLETFHVFAPQGLTNFIKVIPIWIKEKLFMKQMMKRELSKLGTKKIPIVFPEHHLSHAASAYFPSPFDTAAILTIDGVGEWATVTIGYGQGNQIKILRELNFPHSLGLLYSAFTFFAGFKVNSGEYKLMGLAPYGNPLAPQTVDFKKKILDNLIDLREDGSFLLNMHYFKFTTELRMVNEIRWEKLFGLPPREPESELTQDYMNMALAIQLVTEEVIERLAKTIRQLTNARHLVMAGGVALNCVANGKLLSSGIFDDIWIQPAAGDAGGALGAALAAWYIWKGQKRHSVFGQDQMQGTYLGPEFGSRAIVNTAIKLSAPYQHFEDYERLTNEVAHLISKGNVIGWFQGRMEFGPRALGNRSILGDARNPEMQKKINLMIKNRESFRPFAASVREEDIQEYFELDRPSPYMLMVLPIKASLRKKLPYNYEDLNLSDRLNYSRSDLPSITHIDYSTRIQSVNEETNPKYWKLLTAFKELTGYGLLVNTSFNVRSEPMVCTPNDAYQCFMGTEMDYLVMGNYLFDKNEQPKWRIE